MARTKISEFSATPGNNTEIDGINIAEGCAPSGINDAIRELMSQLKDFQAGTAGDSFNGPVGTTTAAAGTFTTLSASSTVSGTGFSTYLASPPAIGGTAAAAGSFTTLSASSTVTLSGGTANGVLYLNASKVATSGSALTFDGTTLQLTNSNISERSSTTAVNGTVLGKYSFSGYDGGAYTEAAKIESQSQSSWAVVSREAGLYFSTLYNSSLGVRYQINNDGTSIWSVAGSEQMRLTSTGLGVGTSSPAVKLDVNGSVNISSGQNLTWGGAYAANIPTMYAVSGANGYFYWSPRGNTGSYMTLDANSNLGLGVTPSAWNNTYKVQQIGDASFLYGRNNGSTFETGLGSNWYRNSGGSFLYLNNGYATLFGQVSGGFQWYTAASGTAGNAISFTQAMTLDSGGNLLVGKTATSNTTVGSEVQSGVFLATASSTSTSLATNNGGRVNLVNSSATDGNFTNIGGYNSNGLVIGQIDFINVSHASRTGAIAFLTHDGSSLTERARIDSSGNLLVGTTSQAASGSILSLKGTVNWGVGPAIAGSTFYIYNASNVGVYLTDGANTWASSSDQRKKDIIEPIIDAANKVSSLRAVIGKYKIDDEGVRRSFLIAQDVQAVLPEAVDATNPEELGLRYTDTIPLLVAAIKELKAEVDSLKAQLKGA